MTLGLERVYAGRRIPPWLCRFESEPDEALSDLLLGGADLEHLNPADPEDVLLDWLDALGGATEIVASVDRALARWIVRAWGDPDPERLGAAVAATAWCRAADLIANQALPGAAATLRERALDDRVFLRSIADGRTRDPEAQAWLALARRQADRHLLHEWWRLCNLPPEAPWYHGAYGIHGLRGLPPENPSNAGTFREEVAEGLARLADALAERVEEGWLEDTTAQTELHSAARLTMSAYPWPEKWLSFWQHAVRSGRLRQTKAKNWTNSLFLADLEDSAEKPVNVHKHWIGPDPDWKRRSGVIALRLQDGDLSAIETANRLIEEQRHYALTSGDTQFIVRSACNFADNLVHRKPEIALAWANIAREFDPWNAYAWTTTVKVLKALDRLDEAVQAGRNAVTRFPGDPAVHTSLAEALKDQKRLDEAEVAYRFAAQRFPDSRYSHNGLAGVLKAQGRLHEAEVAYRFSTERFQDPIAYCGLGGVLLAQGRLHEAETTYRYATKHFPKHHYGHCGLAEVLLGQGRLREAEATYRSATQRFPYEPVPHNGLAAVLLTQGRFQESEAAYRSAIKNFPNDPYAPYGLAEVLKAQDRFDEAENLLTEVMPRFPGNAVIRLALERLQALRSKKAQDEAVPSTTADIPPSTEKSGPQARAVPPADKAVPSNEFGTLTGSEPIPGHHKEDGGEQGLRPRDIEILVTDTHFLRRWARFSQAGALAPSGELREQARKLFERLGTLDDQSPLAAGESGLWLLDRIEVDRALDLLRAAAKRFPGSSRVRYALARAERAAAARRGTLDATDVQRPIRPWRHLARIDPQLRPLSLLGEGRTWLAQSDGATVAQGASASLGHLAYWIHGRIERQIPTDRRLREAREFHVWWARDARRLVFGNHPIAREADLEALPVYQERFALHASDLDRHEEDFLYRQASA